MIKTEDEKYNSKDFGNLGNYPRAVAKAKSTKHNLLTACMQLLRIPVQKDKYD